MNEFFFSQEKIIVFSSKFNLKFACLCNQLFRLFQNSFTVSHSQNNCFIVSISRLQNVHILLSTLLILCKKDFVTSILLRARLGTRKTGLSPPVFLY